MPVDAMTPEADGVVSERGGLWTRRGAPPAMAWPHRHDDVEINVVRSGRLRYLFGGSEVDVDAGALAIFWGVTPHRLVRPGTSESGDVLWLHLPLTTVMSWRLRPEQLATLLQPRPTVVRSIDLGYDAGASAQRWLTDIEADEAEVAFLEIQALVRRVLRHQDPPGTGADAPGRADAVVEMTRFVAARFREPLTPADVARAVHLHPGYAMTLFRRVVGCSIGTYLTRCRVAEAQRLLVTTGAPTTDVGHAAGFGSQSQFYAHFTRICGRSPGRYRAELRGG